MNLDSLNPSFESKISLRVVEFNLEEFKAEFNIDFLRKFYRLNQNLEA